MRRLSYTLEKGLVCQYVYFAYSLCHEARDYVERDSVYSIIITGGGINPSLTHSAVQISITIPVSKL
jgi:hypothetical protein